MYCKKRGFHAVLRKTSTPADVFFQNFGVNRKYDIFIFCSLFSNELIINLPKTAPFVRVLMKNKFRFIVYRRTN